MGRGGGIRSGGPIVMPRLDEPDSATVDERDEHLMLLEAARHTLEVEWTKTLAASDAARDHDVFELDFRSSPPLVGARPPPSP